jgi:hypothetical protein
MFEQASELLDTDNAQSQRCMSLYAWLVLLRACRIVDRHVSERDATIIFTWSCMVVASEGRHPQKAFKLRWPDYLEAISRLADLVNASRESCTVINCCHHSGNLRFESCMESEV